MKNWMKYILVMAAVMLLTACTSSKSTVSSNVNLAQYQYAAIINNDTYHIPAELMEYEIQLFDAVEGSRLQLVSDLRIHELTPEQQGKLLLVKFGVNQTDDDGIAVTVNFIDFMTGRPVASCRGAYSSLGIAGNSYDLNEAIKRVARQISSTFPN